MDPRLEDPRFIGAVDVIKRTGAREVQIRYSDDEQPVIWFAVAGWNVNIDGIPTKHGAGRAWETSSALHPIEAVFRLARQVVDGGQCAHCSKPAAFNTDDGDELLPEFFCWWTWNPEAAKYVQACQI